MTDTDPIAGLATGRPAGPAPVVLHLSITPEGGWHSHASALADILHEQGGERHVFMHWPGATTPRHAETIEFRCTWLGPRATGAITTLRQVAETARRIDADWIHLHGLPSEPVGLVLTLALQLTLLRSRASVALTPHNSFGRRGPIEFRRMRRLTLRRFDRVFIFHDDHRRWAGRRAMRAPFVHPGPDQMLPAGGGDGAATGRHDPTTGPKIACLPGQIRTDKGFHLVPAALAGQDYAIRITGTDNGGFAKLREAAEHHGVPILGQPGFAEERDFLTTIAESDVVILPYTRVTQSGVLAYARATGTPVAGSMVFREAGLAAEAYFDPDDSSSLLAAVEQAIEIGRTTPAGPQAGAETEREAPPVVELYRQPDPLNDLVARLQGSSGVFVVGSPRSGTTVVARWLADRLGADLPPETHYFTLIRRASARSRSRTELHRHIAQLPAYAGATVQDTMAVADGWWGDGGPRSLGDHLTERGDPWVEKTPGHLRHWPELLRFDPRARIVAVTRSVPATLVSQSEVEWLAGREPTKLLARILADRFHIGLLRLVAPWRVDVLRYEDFVAATDSLPDTPSAAMAHEHWKTLSGQTDVVDDRNRAARFRQPTIWGVGASLRRRAIAIPGAVARVVVDVVRSAGNLAQRT